MPEEQKRNPAGRPTVYRPEFARIAAKMAKIGATDPEIAEALGVVRETLWAWRRDKPNFSNAFKIGKAQADERVGRALYQRACGYEYPAQKLANGAVIELAEHVPPDTAAAFIWLKNRRPADWRDRRDEERAAISVTIERAVINIGATPGVLNAGEPEPALVDVTPQAIEK